jgi:hypothetical protein
MIPLEDGSGSGTDSYVTRKRIRIHFYCILRIARTRILHENTLIPIRDRSRSGTDSYVTRNKIDLCQLDSPIGIKIQHLIFALSEKSIRMKVPSVSAFFFFMTLSIAAVGATLSQVDTNNTVSCKDKVKFGANPCAIWHFRFPVADNKRVSCLTLLFFPDLYRHSWRERDQCYCSFRRKWNDY